MISWRLEYVVGESEGTAAGAASFSEAIGSEDKWEFKTPIRLSLILSFLFYFILFYFFIYTITFFHSSLSQFIIPFSLKFLSLFTLSYLEVSMGRARSGLCPTWTRPDLFGWRKIWPKTNSVIWSDFPIRVSSVSGCIGSGIGFIVGNNFWPGLASSGWNLARSFRIWPKSSRICWDLAGSIEIRPWFH